MTVVVVLGLIVAAWAGLAVVFSATAATVIFGGVIVAFGIAVEMFDLR